MSEIGQRLMGDLQRDLGLSPIEAAGIVGNLAHESGNFNTLQEIDPLVDGSRGGFGYAQWTGPRRRQFESWAADRGLDVRDYDANYGFLLHELTQTPEGKVLNQLRGASDPREAAMIFSDVFLRPGIPHHNKRIALAGQYAGMPLGPSSSQQGTQAGGAELGSTPNALLELAMQAERPQPPQLQANMLAVDPFLVQSPIHPNALLRF